MLSCEPGASKMGNCRAITDALQPSAFLRVSSIVKKFDRGMDEASRGCSHECWQHRMVGGHYQSEREQLFGKALLVQVATWKSVRSLGCMAAPRTDHSKVQVTKASGCRGLGHPAQVPRTPTYAGLHRDNMRASHLQPATMPHRLNGGIMRWGQRS